jgi:hypothetical protein
MRTQLAVVSLGTLLLAVPAGAQMAAAAPCVDLSVKAAATPPQARPGFFGRVGRMTGLGSGVDADAGQNICPLTPKQKFAVWAQKSYSPGNLLVAGVDAAVWQATEGRNPQGFGQGWDSYGARFGASLANTESSRFFQTFLFPALLHDDPRYFRAARGSAGHRFGYAITRVLVARGDRGGHHFNFSTVLGAAAAAALSNTYYPEAARTTGRTLGSFGLNLGASAAWNVVYEFGPDLMRKLAGKK